MRNLRANPLISQLARRLNGILFGALLLALCSPARSQSITPNGDGTQTQVTQTGNQYDISGGTTSGQNLFHSFGDFGLSAGEVANFVTQPDILNVLGRINGGNPSVINGLLQLTGSQANLYLLNPVGILFGPEARLNLPASFTATTADGLNFGDGIFNAVGSNNYAVLVGQPDGLWFRTAQPGALLNAGELSLSPGQTLVLAGGTVVNAGTLSTAGGVINLAAVPGEQWVRFRPDGAILSYDIATGTDLAGLTPLALPALLTGTGAFEGITVSPAGAVQLAQLVIPTDAGTVITTGEIDTANSEGTGGAIALLGDTTGVVNALLTATGRDSGGRIYVGGNYRGTGPLPNAQVTYVSADSTLDASATGNGDGGEIILWSDQTTRAYGSLLVRGGLQGGDGGFIETSSAGYLDINGAPDITAPVGSAGTWLIDPNNITIVAGPSGNINQVGSVFTPTADGAQLSVADLNAAIVGGGTVIVSTVGSIGTEAGDITLATPLNYNLGAADTTLRFEAVGSIFINQPLQPSTAFVSRLNLELKADANGLGRGQVRIQGGPVNTNGGNLSIAANGSTLPGPGFVLLGPGATVVTNGGNVTIEGQGSTFPTGQGISLESTSVINSGSGNISLTGSSDNDTGVLINGTLTSLGSITVTGISSNFYGVHLDTPGSISDGFTLLSLGGTSNTNDGLRLEDDLVVTTTSGPLILSGTSTSGRGVFVNGILDTNLADLTVLGNSGAAAAVEIGQIDSGSLNLSGFGGNLIADFVEAVGAVTITTDRLLQVTGTNGFGSSIQTTGSPITITHGGNGVIPFIVGDATVNGVLGTITSATETIAPLQSFLGDYIQGDIQILTDEVASTPAVTPIIPATTPLPNCIADCLPQIEPTPSDPAINDNLTNPTLTIDPSLRGRPAQTIDLVETDYTQEFTDYLGLDGETFPKPDLPRLQEDLALVAEATGIKPAIIYVSFVPPTAETLDSADQARQKTRDGQIWPEMARSAQPSDLLELIVVTPGGTPVLKTIPVTYAEVERTTDRLRSEVVNVTRLNTQTYRSAAQQLYEWLVQPLQSELDQQEIGNLAFVLPSGLRSLPVSALYDGEHFLIERYSVGLVPSVSLTDLRYVDIRNTEVLAMGASNFVDQPELPAVPIELRTIAEQLWPGDFLINETFTPDLLIASRQQKPYGIVHLATHGEFKAGNINNSYIQFWDRRLGIDQVRALQLNNPPVELMVLSACRTALGDEEAELGFAGLAVQAGVKTALASLWKVDDVATAGLMTQFYTSLRQEPIKAEALRQAQLAMLKGEIQVQAGRLIWEGGELMLPPELSSVDSNVFSHPYFWAAFTVIGSPW